MKLHECYEWYAHCTPRESMVWGSAAQTVDGKLECGLSVYILCFPPLGVRPGGSIVMSLYFKIFSASFLITFLFPGIATSINMHVLFSLSRIIMSGLLLEIVLSVCTCWFHSIVTLPPWFVTIEFGTCSYQCFLSSCTPISLHMSKCICALILSCHFTYSSFASIGHAETIWSIVSSCCWYSLHLLSVSGYSIFVTYFVVMLDLVLPLFRSQPLLLSLLSIARGTCLLHW